MRFLCFDFTRFWFCFNVYVYMWLTLWAMDNVSRKWQLCYIISVAKYVLVYACNLCQISFLLSYHDVLGHLLPFSEDVRCQRVNLDPWSIEDPCLCPLRDHDGEALLPSCQGSLPVRLQSSGCPVIENLPLWVVPSPGAITVSSFRTIVSWVLQIHPNMPTEYHSNISQVSPQLATRVKYECDSNDIKRYVCKIRNYNWEVNKLGFNKPHR